MRVVRHARIHASDQSSASHASILLQDAMRTASVPFESSRLLFVRKLDLTIDVGRPPALLAVQIESQLGMYAATAVPASDATVAASAPAVFFNDEVEPYVLAARRIAGGQAFPEWFWKCALPPHVLRSSSPLRSLIETVATTPAALIAVVAFLRELFREPPVLERLLEQFQVADADAVQFVNPSAVSPDAVARTVSAQIPLGLDASALALVHRWARRWGIADPRSFWLGSVALLTSKPALLNSQELLRTQTLATLERLAMVAISTTHDVADALERPDKRAANVIGPAVQAQPPPTEFAGILFLISVLEHISAPVFEDGWPHRFFASLAARFDVPCDDPILDVFDSSPEHHADVRPYIIQARRWLRRYARVGLLTLVRRQGRVSVTRTHVEVYLSLESADIRIRKAGLDLDPGWVPWLGMIVRFHYW